VTFSAVPGKPTLHLELKNALSDRTACQSVPYGAICERILIDTKGSGKRSHAGYQN